MGWKSGAAAGAAAGFVGGPLGAAIGAGIGGFLGSLCEGNGGDGVSIYLRTRGLFFPNAGVDVSVPWPEIEKVITDKDGVYTFRLIGGMEIHCPSNLVKYWSDKEHVIERIADRVRTQSVPPIEKMFEDIEDGESTERVLSTANKSLASISFCKELLPRLQQDKNLVVNFSYCPGKLYCFGLGLHNRYLRTNSSEGKSSIVKWNAEHLAGMLDLSVFFAKYCGEEYSKETDYLKAVTAGLGEFELIVRGLLSEVHDFDRADYAMYQASVSIRDSAENSVGYKDAVNWLAFEFSKEMHEQERRIIVCTEVPRLLGDRKEEVRGVAILRAETLISANNKIREYNEEVETDRYLEKLGDSADGVDCAFAAMKGREVYEARQKRLYQFEVGHPRNGVTYVQHPLEKNMYIDINTFNTTLLERKYDELIRVLLSLGASSITCTISNDSLSGQKVREKSDIGGDGRAAFGSGECSYERSSFSDRTSALNKKLSCKIERTPNQQPYLPKDTVFFQFEDRWQQMAQDVLSGQRKREEVNLSYRKEYSLSCNETRSVSAKLESLIPGFQFGGSANYSDEYEAELKELESVTWHYEVEFGGVVGAAETAKRLKEEAPTAQPACGDKADAMILGRAKRYAKTEAATKTGMLTDAQRADLENLASKYGVDELQLEELIDEAFA